jgi:hypothetical protein
VLEARHGERVVGDVVAQGGIKSGDVDCRIRQARKRAVLARPLPAILQKLQAA